MNRTFLLTLWMALAPTVLCAADPAPRPNILWLTSEDHGPHMGCYGDKVASTPNVDALAKRGMRYRVCWSNAPVCAVARTTLITGVESPSIGGQHMRSMVPLPSGMQLYPALLREAGYYCTNNVKEDYNVTKPANTWDASSNKAHWRNRKSGQPFFAIFNSNKSHESQLRKRPHDAKCDPKAVRIPEYHPDTPEVRRDWAQYYDQVSAADADAGRVLKQLAEDGLSEETIVFYYADHGSGMPRNKRFPCDSGLHVPLVVYYPEKFRHLAPPEYKAGGESERLVSFVDFAPTLLSLAGIKPPAWMQGHAFAGPFDAGPQTYVFGFRDRMDERYDLIRSVRDERYVYVRNYLPHLPYGQHVAYMFETPTTQVWKRLHDAGKLTPAQAIFWNKKPPEELYDLRADRDEVRNLANSPEHQEILKRLRAVHEQHVLQTRDMGFLPEAEMHARAKGSTPYEMARDDARYPIAKIHAAAALASSLDPKAAPELVKLLNDQDSAVRYWAAMGLLMREQAGVAAAREQLLAALRDDSPDVRIAAAQALAQYGQPADLSEGLAVLTKLSSPVENGAIGCIAALNALDALGTKAHSAADTIKQLPTKGDAPHPRFADYAGRLLQDLRGKLPP